MIHTIETLIMITLIGVWVNNKQWWYLTAYLRTLHQTIFSVKSRSRAGVGWARQPLPPLANTNERRLLKLHSCSCFRRWEGRKVLPPCGCPA